MRKAPVLSLATRSYYLLTKPGIIFGNVITMTGGFFLAYKGIFSFILFLATLLGLSFIIASACVFNNYIDRKADAKMERTQNRPFVQKQVHPLKALLFATVLGCSGIYLLAEYTNFLTLFLGVMGFVVYVLFYTFSKYVTIHGTLIGSIAGAMPPVIGYTAVTGDFDQGAFLLFLMMCLWQMPHFYAITIYRMHDYLAASIPTLPIKKGIPVTKIQIILYIFAFWITGSLLTYHQHTGMIFFIVLSLASFYWLYAAIQGFKAESDPKWARKVFRVSLVVVMCVHLSILLEVFCGFVL